MRPLPRLAALIAVLALVVAACTGSSDDTTDGTTTDDTATTTTAVGADPDSDEPLVFGSGTMPATVPDDFPFPEQAVIGTTMIDRTRDVTEVIATYPADVVDVVAFFETNLEGVGYAVVESTGTDGAWDITFEKGDVSGTLSLETAGSGLSQGTIRIVRVTG